MEGQSNLIREQATTMLEQAATMKKQADAMEKQSNLMFDNIKYDHLTKNYDRVNKEMTQLIAPLYSRRKESDLFQRRKLTEKFEGAGANKYKEDHIYYVNFWESIEQNMYLNRSPEFGLIYHNYMINIIDYYEANDKGDDKRKKDIENEFNRIRRPEFIKEIEKRYLELSKVLSEIEKELNDTGNDLAKVASFAQMKEKLKY